MLFSSVIFLLGFLPVFYIIYAFSGLHKNGVLLAASLLFYGWYDPVFVLLIVCEGLFGYFCALWMEKAEARKRILILSVLAIVGIFVFFKYTDFLISTFNSWTGLQIPLLKIILPLGISFYSFQILSYLIDVYKGQVHALHHPVDFLMYICMFPQLIAGPIVRYEKIEPELKKRVTTRSDLNDGAARFICGLSKKVILANSLYACWASALQIPGSFVASIAAMVCNMLYIYYDFSGYSDMAIGLGLMMGFHFPENFNYPIAAKNLTDFWRRWHMSLTGWFRDYLYIPLGGNRRGTIITLRNLFIVWLCTGIWHGAGWTFILWGLGFFILLSLERFVFKDKFAFFEWVWMIFWVLILFDLFSCANLGEFFIHLQNLFNPETFVNNNVLYLLRSNGVLLLISLIGVGPWVRNLFYQSGKVVRYLQPLGSLVLLITCLAFLVNGSFNPFLYFRF